MNYIGFLVCLLGLYGTMMMEGLHVMHVLYAPSAIWLILTLGIGGTLVSFRPHEIREAFSACGNKMTGYSKEAWLVHAAVFSALSRYTMSAGWICVILGTIRVLGGIEEANGEIGKLAAGIALSLIGPLLGTFISKFYFDPLRNHAERMASGPDRTDRSVDSPLSTPVAVPYSPAKPLVKIILFSAIAIGFIAVTVLVAWKVASVRIHDASWEKRDSSDTAAIHRRYSILRPFLLGTRQKPGFELVVVDRGTKHHLRCTIHLGYSRDYDRRGSELFSELTDRLPALREIVIRVLGGKSVAELQSVNLDRIEEEVLFRINEVLEHGSVVDIMFSEYTIE